MSLHCRLLRSLTQVMSYVRGPVVADSESSRSCSWTTCLHICRAAASNASLRRLADPDGRMLNGWQQQLDVIVATHAFTPLEQRKPKVMWRGRAADQPRDEVRCATISTRGLCFVGGCKIRQR